jgi:hypothetical protein
VFPVRYELNSYEFIHSIPDTKIEGQLIINNQHFGFEGLTTMTIMSTIFWDVTPCRPVVHRRLRGSYCLPYSLALKTEALRS